MLRNAIVFCLIVGALSTQVALPKVVIVGAGASGIAAATRLLENGFHDLVILEAEDRIGGRVCTVPFGEYKVDLGAQWIHGEKGNVAYELAAPLNLTDHASVEGRYFNAYTSSGEIIDQNLVRKVLDFYMELFKAKVSPDVQSHVSIGDYYTAKFGEYFKEHPEISTALHAPLLWHFNLIATSYDPADTWSDVSANGFSEYEECEGDQAVNWKERGYGTILEILMKKIPNPEEELPVLNKTIFNAEVVNVDYSGENVVKVKTADGTEHEAQHVIMTPSLGVLKAEYNTLFKPPLSETKIKTIKNLGYGNACKIFLLFDEIWWGDKTSQIGGYSFLLTDEERNEYKNDREKAWLVHLLGFFFVQHKPRLLEGWVSGEGALLIENVSDDKIFNQSVEFLHKFLSKDYNITRPVQMIRSKWPPNKHFRGTYSYVSMDTGNTNSTPAELAEPIMKNERPVVLFGGEATSSRHSSTVHGAIGSGWREADRLINFYRKLSSPLLADHGR